METSFSINFKTSFNFWNKLPVVIQFFFTRVYAGLFSLGSSKFLIGPFCKINSLESSYLDQFCPQQGGDYLSFQDFFTRRLRRQVVALSSSIWPCEGYVCQQGLVSKIPAVEVKGEWRTIDSIFALSGSEQVPRNHCFTNIFLHNHNYHRIHSPVSGKILRIHRVPGKLNFLRPWLYQRVEVSKPALCNERVNFEIEDFNGEIWYLSAVGGMGVGTVKVLNDLKAGSLLNIGDELALFYLGSTCCIASPEKPVSKRFLESVGVGDIFSEVRRSDIQKPNLKFHRDDSLTHL